MPRKCWTPEKIIEELKRVRCNGPKSHRLLDDAARRHFGSLRAALKVADLPIRRKTRFCREWTPKEVVKAICNRHHSGQDLNLTSREDRALYEAAKRLFGSWMAAREAAGLSKPKVEFYTVDEVQLRIIELYENECLASFTGDQDRKLLRSAKKHFGGWRNAVKSLGLESEMPRRWSVDIVIEEIQRRRAMGHSIYKTCTEDPSLYSAGIRYFGSWETALRAAGVGEPARQRWNEAKIIARLKLLSAEHPRESVWRHDINLATAAKRRFGTVERALEVAGIKVKRLRRKSTS